MEAFGGSLQVPWLVLGDFNCNLHLDDRMGGKVPSPYDIRDFTEICQALNLSDIQSYGCRYTWTNCSISNPIWSKLDRALGNDTWMQNMNYVVNFLPAGCISDHSPSLVVPANRPPIVKSAFKFFNMWAGHNDFQSIVGKVWDQSMHGVEQYKLCKRLKLLKQPLRKLNEKEFSHITSRAVEARGTLELMQEALQQDVLNPTLLNAVADQTKRAKFLSEAERSFVAQKAKCEYLKDMDRGTKFFYGVVKKNHKRKLLL